MFLAFFILFWKQHANSSKQISQIVLSLIKLISWLKVYLLIEKVILPEQAIGRWLENISIRVEIIGTVDCVLFGEYVDAQENTKIDHESTHVLVVSDVRIDGRVVGVEERQQVMENTSAIESNTRLSGVARVGDDSVEIIEYIVGEPEQTLTHARERLEVERLG